MRVFALFLCMLTCINVFGQGKFKPGKYAERYDIPFVLLKFEDGRSYENGTFRIYIDIENNPNAIFIQMNDANGEYIANEYFIDDYPPLVYYKPEEKITSIRGKILTISDVYTLYWGPQQYLFYRYPGGNYYKIEFLYKDGNNYVRKKDSFTCTLFGSDQIAPNIARVFKEAQRRRAISLKK